MTTQTTHSPHEESREKSPLRMPPTERDFEVYQLVTIEQNSTRMVAKMTGISQTRVCQIIDRVAEYLISTAPTTEDPARKQQQLNASRQMAAQQIRFLGQQAMRCFERSIGPTTTVRQVAGETPQHITSTRKSDGDLRYLFAVAKLAVIGSDLPLARELSAAARPVEEEVEEVAAEMPVAPSEEACSVEANEQQVTANDQTIEAEANDSPEMACVEAGESQPSRKVEIARPVHPVPANKARDTWEAFGKAGVLKKPAIELSPFARAALGMEPNECS